MGRFCVFRKQGENGSSAGAGLLLLFRLRRALDKNNKFPDLFGPQCLRVSGRRGSVQTYRFPPETSVYIVTRIQRSDNMETPPSPLRDKLIQGVRSPSFGIFLHRKTEVLFVADLLLSSLKGRDQVLKTSAKPFQLLCKSS